jgi:hypothetical protein
MTICEVCGAVDFDRYDYCVTPTGWEKIDGKLHCKNCVDKYNSIHEGEESLEATPTIQITIHECAGGCGKTLEEVDGKFPPESKNWIRARRPDGEVIYLCSSKECTNRAFQKSLGLNREQRRKIQKLSKRIILPDGSSKEVPEETSEEGTE